MEDGLFSRQGKKLLMIGLFLWCVAALVGGEEDPGIVAQIGDHPPAAPAAAPPQTLVAQPAPAPRPARRPPDPDLDAWYAETGPAGPAVPAPVAPTPVDESHLIDDTAPVVVATPIG